MYKFFLKRFFDIIFSFLAILCLSPLFILLSVWLHIANKGAGVFFVQPRPGKDGKVFHIYKFKSMTDELDENGKLLPDAQRLTKVGRFVRSTSLDELPQLFNVFIGDMSFIGPRPLTICYLAYYNDKEKHRHDVRPGITGLAQIKGRKSVSWKQKFDYDLEYVSRLSFCFDLYIFVLTIYKVFRRDDVGVDTSGINDFDAFRESEWEKEGLTERIINARKLAKELERKANYVRGGK